MGHHCNNYIQSPMTRRQMLTRCASGFGGVALTALLADQSFGAPLSQAVNNNPLAPKPGHHKAKAKSCITVVTRPRPCWSEDIWHHRSAASIKVAAANVSLALIERDGYI